MVTLKELFWDPQASVHPSSYALDSLVLFQACPEDLLQALEAPRLVSMRHNRHQDCREVPWDQWEAMVVLQQVLLEVLSLDLGF